MQKKAFSGLNDSCDAVDVVSAATEKLFLIKHLLIRAASQFQSYSTFGNYI
jgi:hypothetical protein